MAGSKDSSYMGLLTSTHRPEIFPRESWLGKRRAGVTFQTGEGCGLLSRSFGRQCEI